MAHISAGLNGLRMLVWVMGIVLIGGAVMLTSIVYQQIDHKSKHQGLPCALALPETIKAPLPIIQTEIKGGLMLLLSHPKAKNAVASSVKNTTSGAKKTILNHATDNAQGQTLTLTTPLSDSKTNNLALVHSASGHGQAKEQILTIVNLCSGEQQTVLLSE